MRTLRPRVLCVDDEPQVLESLEDLLHRDYEVLTATNGFHALKALDEQDVAVVVSDMRMPAIDGARFLALARRQAPDTVRILLTGHSDIDQAVAAVNEGQIFRFLTKPVAHSALVEALSGAVAQHELARAERALLRDTLHASLAAMAEVLALADPVAHGRAARVRRSASRLAEELGIAERWPLETAALLSQLGAFALPHDLVGRLRDGDRLTTADRNRVRQMPAHAARLVGGIPRLDEVLEILDPPDPPGEAAQVLRLALDFELVEGRGVAPEVALAALAENTDRYEPRLLEAFGRVLGTLATTRRVVDLPLADVVEGMTFAEDVRLPGGAMLAARGVSVTAPMALRLRSLPSFGRHLVRVLAD